MDTSTQVAGLLGPTLMLLSISEYFNFKIWKTVDPTVVTLNGLLLFIGGLVIVRYHNFWITNWTLTITIVGWLVLILGVYRMLFPTGRQLHEGRITNIVLFNLFLVGCFLTFKAYSE